MVDLDSNIRTSSTPTLEPAHWDTNLIQHILEIKLLYGRRLFDLRSRVLSLLQFPLVQKNSYSMYNKPTVDVAGEAFLHVRTAVAHEYIVDIAVRVAMWDGCWGRCQGCSITSSCQDKVCHRIHNNKEVTWKMICRDWECSLNLNIFVWMISQVRRTYQLRLC